ncbi:hypothetical protein PanWU01x14_268180 [Parasponia andersonii]|uniref:Uncharacterized protein n=1 Tax=Parasponia andersonii TaxID=3476 RepID=A0A2P5B6C0_PARAD|nr:hypothetical protein PanWU01x14_268180 [Parasponia andersonii]
MSRPGDLRPYGGPLPRRPAPPNGVAAFPRRTRRQLDRNLAHELLHPPPRNGLLGIAVTIFLVAGRVGGVAVGDGNPYNSWSDHLRGRRGCGSRMELFCGEFSLVSVYRKLDYWSSSIHLFFGEASLDSRVVVVVMAFESEMRRVK